MWTFLGIASLTYVYKKCDVLLFWARRELLIAAMVFLIVGAILTFHRYWGQKTAQILQLPLEILSILPFTDKIIHKSGSCQRNKAAGANKKVSYDHAHGCLGSSYLYTIFTKSFCNKIICLNEYLMKYRLFFFQRLNFCDVMNDYV